MDLTALHKTELFRELGTEAAEELAELSDTTLFTVSRTISAWKKAGIIDGGRAAERRSAAVMNELV